MIRISLATAAFLTVAGVLAAQQPNTPNGSMVINNQDGPVYPTQPVPMPRGVSSSVTILGAASQPFIVGGSAGLRPSGASFPYGLLDLDLVSYGTVFNGLTNALFFTDGTGTWTALLPIASNTPLNQTRAFQGIVSHPGFPQGAILTAASRVVIAPGVTTQNISLGDDSTFNFSLASYGFTLPYFTQTYSSVFVNSNGSLSFGAGNTDYTATASEFLGGTPQIAGFWTDLNPSAGGTVVMNVDQTTAVPFIRCDFNNVSEFAVGTPHSFSMSVYSIVGDVIIAESGFNPQALIDTVVGISPGTNQSTHAAKDLSSLTIANYPLGGLLGGTNENFHEYFPIPPNQPIWDLAGRTLQCSANGAGTASAAYRVLVYP